MSVPQSDVAWCGVAWLRCDTLTPMQEAEFLHFPESCILTGDVVQGLSRSFNLDHVSHVLRIRSDRIVESAWMAATRVGTGLDRDHGAKAETQV